ncbi:hypothetical protein HPB50_028880 [Hyalomma asiaticum]|nr:hypothetical protein HPB50_028880 [Hyalomma asiaticum]
MASNQAAKTGKANDGPPKAVATPGRTGASNPPPSQVPAPPIAAEEKRGSLHPTAGALPYAGARGPNAPTVVAPPPPPKGALPPGAAGPPRARILEQPEHAAARQSNRSSRTPNILAIPMSPLNLLSPLGPEVIATPSMTHGPLALRTKKEQKQEAARSLLAAAQQRGPNEVIAPLLPAVQQAGGVGAPDGLRARRQQCPSTFLRPMAIGPSGTPELVAFPSSWRSRQWRAEPGMEYVGDAAGGIPDDERRASAQKGVYPVMEIVEEDNPTSRPGTPQETPPEKEDEQCGCCWFRPPFLRVFRTPGWVLLSLCSIEFTQSFVNSGVLSVVLPTIERRFNLSSFETGMILSTFNVVNCLFIVPVAFLGSTRHKPVIIASGMAIMSAGSFLFFLSYVIEPPYAYGAELPDLCYTTPPPMDQTLNMCDNERAHDARFLLFLGSMLQGAGVTPLHTLGMSFLDENLPVKLTSLFVGTYSAMAVLGPAFGFLVAGYFLSVFVDLKDVSPLGLTTQSSVWIGAWWVGFLVAAVMGGIVSIPMAAFPKHLPSYQQCQMVRRLHANKSDTDRSTYGQYVSELPRSILSILKNVPFVMITLASVTEAMVGTAVAAFSVKFFEAEFAMTPSRTAAALAAADFTSECNEN